MRSKTTITRRQVLNAMASAGVGMAASPLLSATVPGTRMIAAIFFESYATVALRRALRYAGVDGFVASMPQLLHARVNAGYDNIIWNTWFSANSEENVVTTAHGNHVVVTVHGGGIFASPERIERSLRADFDRNNTEGLTAQYAARVTAAEARNLLNGRLPGGSEIPIYPFNEFERGISDLPMRYGVVLDFETAKSGPRDYQPFDVLKDGANMIVRAGGVEPLLAYLDRAKARHDTDLMGNWHSHKWIDPTQPQARVLRIGGNQGGVDSEGKDLGLGYGYDEDYGIAAGWPAGFARYVAVSLQDDTTSLRNLDFEL